MQSPSRSLCLAGASNFRDLGGYAGQGGQTVRWRRLFRSDHLGALTSDDAAQLAGLGVGRTVDLRTRAERAAVPSQLPGVAQYALPIEPMVMRRMAELMAVGRSPTAHEAVALMEQTYRGFVDEHAQRFAELFGLLLDADTPLVFHCTAGKDRTGFAAALILLALGVPRPLVMQDYLLTNALYRRPPAPAHSAPAEVMEVLWRVQAGFLDAALHSVDTAHGGVDAYLRQRLGLGERERARLAALYLEHR